MDFGQSISTCFNKYADFNGRATRAEYWWFVLFLFLVSCGLTILNHRGLLSGLFHLATIVPAFAVGARRLHDTNRSGWWQLFFLVPLVGWIVVLVFVVQESDAGPNRFDSAE